MAASSALSDGAQQADMVSNENAEAMFGADQAETNMVKLVDGKLTPIGDTEDDVMDEQLQNRYGSDEERALQNPPTEGQKTYENSEAALRVGNAIDPEADTFQDDPIADADLTQDQQSETTDTGYALDESSEGNAPANTASQNDSTPNDRVQANGADQTQTFSGLPTADMMPPQPTTPDPNYPMPGGPETPPTPPSPGPEIPTLPGSPSPDKPEITDPTEPDRSHEINGGSNSVGQAKYPNKAPLGFGYYGLGGFAQQGSVTKTSTMSVAQNVEPSTDDVQPGEAVPGTQYVNMSNGLDDEGMDAKPDTGTSDLPYNIDSHRPTQDHQEGERPEEKREAEAMPRELVDESTIEAQNMLSPTGEAYDATPRSDVKSTDGLDRKYNDPAAARDMAS
ncbi:hypothetical protein [Fibrella aquatilis]|uniref:Uncharacterized protein n=1 Tax=Fibrella aquatilis TaxID=2817059 RepID=A0A939G638_9BACT|nr:hypothetical protein [Fibrella aquatilis]MBO0932839.1 hypothetical protein [Fibrella aquatilis]